jgi:hypothetical protein
MSTAAVFACDLGAMSREERATHSRVVRELFGAVERIDALPNGYAFHLPATSAALRATAEFLDLERLCCPFFAFVVELPAAAAALRLSVTGPEGVQPFVRAEFGAALPAGVPFPSEGQAPVEA